MLIPTQKADDRSVVRFSTTSMRGLIEQTAAFCAAQGLSLVVKIHPALPRRETRVQAGWVTALNATALRGRVFLSKARAPNSRALHC